MKRGFISDKELAALLAVSASTISRSVRGIGGKRDVLGAVKPVYVCGARRWRLVLVARALGMTAEELEKML